MNNQEIIFKSLNHDHLPLLHQWFQKPHILQWYARGKEYSLEMIKQKYEPRLNDSTIQSFIIYVDSDPIGYIQFYKVSHHFPEGVSNYDHPLFNQYKRDEIAGIDFFIADEKYLKKGYASSTFMKFINTLKGKFKAVVVDPMKTNEQAILFFKRIGFCPLERGQNDIIELMILNLD